MAKKIDTSFQDLSFADLTASIAEEKAILNQKKFNHVINPIDNHNELKHARKHIARMKTELNARKNRGDVK